MIKGIFKGIVWTGMALLSGWGILLTWIAIDQKWVDKAKKADWYDANADVKVTVKQKK